MPKKDTRIIIVGAGPVGCYLGQLLKHHGFDPLILEEHAEIGKPVQCAGIVGANVFEDLKIPPSRKSILNSLDGAKVSYQAEDFSVSRKKVAYVIDREVFDKELSKGLNIELNTKFLGFAKNGQEYTLKTSRGDYQADVVIGADGPHSKVRKAAGMKIKVKMTKGAQFRLKAHLYDKKAVEVRYIKPFSFFSWVIPEGNGVVRMGTISDKPWQDLKDFMKERGIKGEIVERLGGPIPIGSGETVKDGVALVGDAACQVKPITSGGLYYGLRSAEELAQAIKEDDLSSYDERWRKLFGKEIKFCLIVREMLDAAGPETLGKIFSYFKENSAVIEKFGDFENHSSIFWGLATNPKAYQAAGALLGDLLKKIKVPFVR